MTKHYVDTVSDFDRAAENLPREVREELDERQRGVAAARDRAETNDELLRMRVQARRQPGEGPPATGGLLGRLRRLLREVRR